MKVGEILFVFEKIFGYFHMQKGVTRKREKFEERGSYIFSLMLRKSPNSFLNHTIIELGDIESKDMAG